MASVTQEPNPRPKVGISRPWLNLLMILGGLAVAGVVLLGLILLVSAPDSIFGPIWAGILNVGDNVLGTIFNANRVNPAEVVQCRTESGCSVVQSIVFSAIFLLIIVTGFAYTTLLERRFIAFFQQRVGPNRVGPAGLLQPAADGVKLVFKEDIIPDGADRPIYLMAPMLKTIPTLILLAVIPLAPDWIVPWFDGRWYQVPVGLADPAVGVLWLMAVTSLGTYGVVLAGWSSNNKYAAIGGLRASAQMLSYELSLGLAMVVPVVIVGSMSIGDIVRSQTYIYQWFIFQNPLAAGILFLALLAEINRAPFDLPEAEQELTAGYMTEYSGMKFALFMMAEYLGMIGISVVVSSLYLGGYNDGFGLVNSLPILGPIVLLGKVVLLLILMIWIRSTLPRIRYDRLMSLGWKVLLPLALVAVGWSAIAVLVGDTFDSPMAYAAVSGIIFLLIVVGGIMLLRRAGDLTQDPPDLMDDPVITGERRGFAAVALQVLGGILALPFILYNFTLKALDSLASLAPDEKPAPVVENKDDSAIVPTEGTGD